MHLLAADPFSWERFLSGQSGVLLGFLMFGVMFWKIVIPFIREQITSIRDVVEGLRKSVNRFSRVMAIMINRGKFSTGEKIEAREILDEIRGEKET